MRRTNINAVEEQGGPTADQIRASLQIDVASLSDTKNKISEKIRDIEEEKVKLEKRVVELQNEISVLGDRKVETEKELQKQKTELMVEIDNVNDTLDIMESKVSSAKDELGKIQNDIKISLDKRDELDGFIKEHEARLVDLSQRYNLMSKQIVDDSLRLEKLSNTITGQVNESKNLEKIIEDRKLVLADMESKSQNSKVIDDSILAKRDEYKKIELEVNSVKETLVGEQKKLSDISLKTEEKLNILAIAEARLDQKLEYARKYVEQSKATGLLKGDFNL